LFYAFDVILWNEGISKVNVNLAVVIMFLVPVWINILSKIILKEDSFNLRHLFALFLCFIGLAFIVNKIDSMTINMVFIFLNSFVVSLGLVFQKKWKSIRPIRFSLFFNSLILLGVLICINHLKGGKFLFFEGGLSLFSIGFCKAIIVVVVFDVMEFTGKVFRANR
jgi:drug/metabolite transporter (DMT)-like permease